VNGSIGQPAILALIDSTMGMVGDLQTIAGKAMPEIPGLDTLLLENAVEPERTVHSGRGTPCDVTTTCFTDEPCLERLDGLHLPRKQIQAPPTALAETPPFAHQCSIAEESRFDREHIEPCHVAGRIAAFKHEVLHREFGHAQESQLSKLPSN
jgi:hypothetical protein